MIKSEIVNESSVFVESSQTRDEHEELKDNFENENSEDDW